VYKTLFTSVSLIITLCALLPNVFFPNILNTVSPNKILGLPQTLHICSSYVGVWQRFALPALQASHNSPSPPYDQNSVRITSPLGTGESSTPSIFISYRYFCDVKALNKKALSIVSFPCKSDVRYSRRELCTRGVTSASLITTCVFHIFAQNMFLFLQGGGKR